MFKLWIDRTGAVRTFSVGDMDEQHKDFVKVLRYLQGRVSASERIVEEANKTEMKKEKQNG